MQYTGVTLGSSIAYLYGGLLFTNHGFVAICYFGVALVVAQIILTIIYLIHSTMIMSNRSKVRGHNERNDEDDIISVDVKSVIYKLEALRLLKDMALDALNDDTDLLMEEDESLVQLAKFAKSDKKLYKALGELYDHYKAEGSGRRASGVEGMLAASLGATTRHCEKDISGTASSLKEISAVVNSLVGLKGGGLTRMDKSDFLAYMAPRVFDSIHGSSQEGLVTVIWPYMRLIVATQAIMALCIGCFLSTALLSYTDRFDINASEVGLFLALGECMGCLNLFVPSIIKAVFPRRNARSISGKNFMGNFLGIITSRPLHIPIVLLITSISTMSFSINVFPVAVVFQIIMSSVNDLSVSLLNELIATSLPSEEFRTYQVSHLPTISRDLKICLFCILTSILCALYSLTRVWGSGSGELAI